MTSSLLVAGLLSLLAASEETPDATADAVQDDAAADEGPKYPNWSGYVDVGIVQKSGNTESFNGTLASKIIGDYEASRTTITSWWLYEDDSGDITERKYGTRGKYDRFLGTKRRNYLYALGQVGTDLAANVDIRYFGGGGVGWVWRDEKELRFSTDIGLTYLVEDFRDGTDDDKGNYLFLYDLDWSLNDKAGYESDFIGQMAMSDSDDVLLTWVHAIAWDIGYNFRAGFRYTLDWDNTPAAGSKRDDHVLAFTLGWKFGKKN
jgi:putative salt-induced outer membrane protein YdiY